jgi:hypothetical protein
VFLLRASWEKGETSCYGSLKGEVSDPLEVLPVAGIFPRIRYSFESSLSLSTREVRANNRSTAISTCSLHDSGGQETYDISSIPPMAI